MNVIVITVAVYGADLTSYRETKRMKRKLNFYVLQKNRIYDGFSVTSKNPFIELRIWNLTDKTSRP